MKTVSGSIVFVILILAGIGIYFAVDAYSDQKRTEYKEGHQSEWASMEPPANCVRWYDGCNSCSVQADGSLLCTLMACSRLSEPSCLEFSH